MEPRIIAALAILATAALAGLVAAAVLIPRRRRERRRRRGIKSDQHRATAKRREASRS